MKKKNFALFAVLTLCFFKAQVGINTENPRAALDIVSDKSGILIPRMTAAQIEQITAPAEGELVYSTSDTGSVVNLIGFWYYAENIWSPITATSSIGENIYIADGTLSGNRVVSLSNYNLNIGPDKLFISGSTGNIGINTPLPTEKLDINGGMRIRNLPGGNVITTAEGVLSFDTGLINHYGDIQYSYLSTDHEGWYLLNGRTLSTLPVNVQPRATGIGITGNLPNAAGRYIKQGTPGTVSGAPSVVLSQANFPNFVLNGTTTTFSHNHSVISPGYPQIRLTNITQGATGTANSWQIQGGAQIGSPLANQTYTTAAAGAHNHTVTIPTGGTGTFIALNPSYIQLNYFIYLGI
ncbi:hypothetical protein A0O34_21255 [Chryseobacterium glaciei]|uniref:Phage tail collar domain-containing protein n=1 Tax=Chryseobacterium glaciei TaxID=1685010 RepID=A0A172Y0V4_9FLAO|nr:hypothetical protein [Chryseobacterium glaciei]ANF52893.1 hypothetical protein A0O34_21255 [Chryseobacterium glaciei]